MSNRPLALVLALIAAASGCGGDGDQPDNEENARGIDDRKIANALGMRLDGGVLIYETPSGTPCQVIEIAQTSADVKRVMEDSEFGGDAVATTPGGGAGVEFVGPVGGAPPRECVEAAVRDLANLSGAVSELTPVSSGEEIAEALPRGVLVIQYPQPYPRGW